MSSFPGEQGLLEIKIQEAVSTFDSLEKTESQWSDDSSIPCHEMSDTIRLVKEPMVSVLMITYNHEKYISQAIEGVLKQKCDFGFELILGEDCSQDWTREICFEYQKRHPDKIRVLWSDANVSSINGNSRRCRARARGKYIAYCEGDDYWTDPRKLQKQVDYMEGHPECAGCFHERVIAHFDGHPIPGTELPDEMKHALTGDDIAAWTFPCPPTCTVLYRREVTMDRPTHLNKWFAGDRAAALWAAYSHGTVDWVDGVQPSVYRFHSGGVFRGMDELRQIIQEHATDRQTFETFPVCRRSRRAVYRKWEKQTFRAWRKWHGSESAETRKAVRELIRQDVASWPPLRWRLWRRQLGYCFGKGRDRMWHGMVTGIKRVLPDRAYSLLRKGWRERQKGGVP